MIPYSVAFRQCPPDEKNQPLLRERYLTPPVAGYERKKSAEWIGPVHREGQNEKGLRMRSPWRFIGVSWRDRSVESRQAGSVSLDP